MDEKRTSNHKIIIDDREKVEIDGVSDVLAFDEQEIVLETDRGMLVITGEDIHVNQLNLNSGRVQLDGSIDNISYSDVGHYQKSSSFIGKLFKG